MLASSPSPQELQVSERYLASLAEQSLAPAEEACFLRCCSQLALQLHQ